MTQQLELFNNTSIQEIIEGDCLEVMRKMESSSITHILTDPPYFLTNNSGSGFMGKSWDSIQGLSKYLWENQSFVNSALNLLNLCMIELNTEEENSVPRNVNMILSKEAKNQIANVLVAKLNLSSQNAQKRDSAQLLVLTRQEVWDLLKELLPSHTKTVEIFLNGVKDNAVFVIPITSLQKELNRIAHKNVLQKLKVKDIEEKEIHLTPMDHQKIKNVIEVMTGTKSENWFTKEISGNVNLAPFIVKENKFNAITLFHIERVEIMNYLTSLLCVINAILESSTIQNYLINNFFELIFKEALRVCKPGAHLLAFSGTRTHHKLAIALEKSGWEIRDTIFWCYGSGFPKSHNFKEGDFKGFGTALKPAVEPCIMAMKPLDGTFAQNAEKHGVAGINIDECRIEHNEEKISVKGTLSSGGILNQTQGNRIGEYLSKGRWPANIIFDEEAGQLLDEQSGILKSGSGNRRPNGGGDMFNGFSPINAEFESSSGGASRFFYCAKASPSERSKENKHPTVKPIKLMEYLLKLITPPKDGIVLDAFMGSGTTLLAAKNLNINAIGIELNKDYCEIARNRLKNN